MRLRGVNFGYVLGASGVQGFFGEGYRYHRWIPGLSFHGMTFVSKTVTVDGCKGNMESHDGGYTPARLLPKCIYVDRRCFLGGYALNAIGLTGPPVKKLLKDGQWQQRTKPFMISYMPIRSTKTDRLSETEEFSSLLKDKLPQFRASIGIQLNLSCPNKGHDLDAFMLEAGEHLNRLADPDLPLMIKVSVVHDPAMVARITGHSACDGICVSNTIPFGKLREEIDWKGLFGSEISPLRQFGGGGLSGKPLNRLVYKWIERYRVLDAYTPINAGGGVMGYLSGKRLLDAGAHSVFLGSIAMLRGWKVQSTIWLLNQYAARKESHYYGID